MHILTAIVASFVLVSAASAAESEFFPQPSPEEFIDLLYEERIWVSPKFQTIDPLKTGINADIPILPARARVIGSELEDSVRSLAVKLWLIDNARHTVDLAYYIFKRDRVGYALIGALCRAVKRGVDIRLIVDSIGSFHPTHYELGALESCAKDAGYMRTVDGALTGRRARIEVKIFNSISYLSGRLRSLGRAFTNLFREEPLPRIQLRLNRRSHDKLIVVDGYFPDRAVAIIGGRNISLSYYGIRKDGSVDPHAYKDLELMVRPPEGTDMFSLHVGNLAEKYFDILFKHLGNKPVRVYSFPRREDPYVWERDRAFSAWEYYQRLPRLQPVWAEMSQFVNEGLERPHVRLTHELDNLTNKYVTTRVRENFEKNPNSIMLVLHGVYQEADFHTSRLVSPYIFLPLYQGEENGDKYDEAEEIREWVAQDPKRRVEIITNSVLTGDNVMTQALIDIKMLPRLLLPPDLFEAWSGNLKKGELNPEVVESEAWKKAVANPQIFVYQTGRLDSKHLENGKVDYGKLHAKFLILEGLGFVGTTNFDYRSRLLNNEAGFFYRDEQLSKKLIEEFELLKSQSYRWGSPEWLEMRRRFMREGGFKGTLTRWQRGIAGFLIAFNLTWMF